MADMRSFMAARKAATQETTNATTGDVERVAPGQPEPVASGPVSPPTGVSASAPDQAKPKLAFFKSSAPAPVAPLAKAEPEPSDDSFDLTDLANLTDEGKAPSQPRSTRSQFADETPATAPVRDLPADMEKQQQDFVSLMDGVYELVNDSEMLGHVIRSIMIELKTYPQYMKMVSQEDVRLWVRSMRDSMGLARIKKQEKATKAKGGGTGKKTKGVDSDMAEAFADLGLSIDDL